MKNKHGMSGRSSAAFFTPLMVIALTALIALSPAVFAEESWRARASADSGAATDDIAAEIDFGREVGARILGRYPLYDEKTLMKYVNLVGKSLAQNTNRPEIDFHFAVIDTADINAYAAPGGYVFITKGALAAATDEAELAGVLAHEITHVSEKHIVKELNIKSTADSPAAGLARVIGGASESARLAFSQAVDKALDTLFKDGYKREDEIRADKGAAVLCALSGYDPAGLARYLDRIKASKAKKTEILDKTHPPYDARVALINETISAEGIDAAGLKSNKDRFEQMLKGMK